MLYLNGLPTINTNRCQIVAELLWMDKEDVCVCEVAHDLDGMQMLLGY
jgi:hypothetical protein